MQKNVYRKQKGNKHKSLGWSYIKGDLEALIYWRWVQTRANGKVLIANKDAEGYLDEVQHGEGEVLVAEAAVHHHLHECQQRARQLTKCEHDLGKRGQVCIPEAYSQASKASGFNGGRSEFPKAGKAASPHPFPGVLAQWSEAKVFVSVPFGGVFCSFA